MSDNQTAGVVDHYDQAVLYLERAEALGVTIEQAKVRALLSIAHALLIDDPPEDEVQDLTFDEEDEEDWQ